MGDTKLHPTERLTTADDDIAVIGMACRTAGCTNTDELWQLLRDGRHAITHIACGEAKPMPSGVIDSVDAFDAKFFRIAPRESERMDPRQRVALEVAWEALENAGVPVDQLQGAPIGVFLGESGHGSAPLLLGATPKEGSSAYDVTGTLAGVIAGRLSYVFGFRGPCITLDTTCSSALVAIHLACQSLRAGECDAALAGGVSTLPRTERELASWSELMHISPSGRCSPFDASADGVIGGDGCGVVVLKTLRNAMRDGDEVLAVLRGSAINHDGRTLGLTVPSRAAQEAVLRTALAKAKVAAADVDFVETHGTGTLLGDPIEAHALGEVHRQGRTPDRPLLLGAMKGNIGHTGSAAGVMGLIKVILALRYEQFPGNPHFLTPSPQIAWSDFPVKVSSSPVAWRRGERVRIAGVSGFGLSGTNAHLVVAEPPQPKRREAPPVRAAEIVVLSARSDEALSQVAARLEDWIDRNSDVGLPDIAHDLATRRTHHEVRLAMSTTSVASLRSDLAVASRGRTPPGATRGAVHATRGRTAWLLPGQGSQVVGMGRGLYEEWPVFRGAFDEALAAVQKHLHFPLRDIIWSDAKRLDETECTQPALFALGVALGALWRSWAVEPDVVAGHSIGEIGAACLAGVLSLEDAGRLVAARARLMQSMPRGAMASINAPEAEVRAALAQHGGGVCVAAINRDQGVVVAGPEASVAGLAEKLVGRGIRATRLAVSHAFHSSMMDPMLEPLREVARGLRFHAPRIPVISNVTGAISAEVATPDYWVTHAREPVRFADGVRALRATGVTRFVELGAKPTLLGLIADGAKQEALIASLRPGRSEPEAILDALGRLHVDGAEIAWTQVVASSGGRVRLPTYPWQRQLHAPPVATPRRPTSPGRPTNHAMLGVRLALADNLAVYESVLSRESPRWIVDHAVAGEVVVPGAALAELLCAAATRTFDAPAEVLELALPTALVLPEGATRRIQVVVAAGSDGRARVSLFSRADADDSADWVLHAAADASRVVPGAGAQRLELAELHRRCTEPVDVEAAYGMLAELGLKYGPAFRGMRRAWRGDREVLAELELPSHVDDSSGFGVHPALLDAAFHAALLAVEGLSGLYVPFAMGRVIAHAASLPASVVSHARLRHDNEGGASADVTIADATGRILVEVTGLRSRRFAPAAARVTTESTYRVQWQPTETPASSRLAGGTWLVVGPDLSPTCRALVAHLRSVGAQHRQVDYSQLEQALPVDNVVCIWEPPSRDEDDAATRLASAGLVVVQTLVKHMTPTRAWWITRGAQAPLPLAERPIVDPASAALWGLGRTVRQEHPELDLCLVDLDPSGASVDSLVRELGATDDEREIAWRGANRHTARLERALAPAALPTAENWALTTSASGMLDALAVTPAVRRAPAHGEVEIEVRASGLNFRDVLNALGMYPGDAGPLGGECAGVVVRTGAGVTRVAVGDAVMAFAPGAFQRYVTVDSRLVVAKPSGLTWEQASGVPLVFLTAWYALCDLAQLRRGERVVIHAAAGGVGMAAVQVAHLLGAEVLATASPPKWEVVRALGVRQVANSRDLTFVPVFGQTADVVLNALAGEFVDASLGLLKRGGRFLEMGKSDVRDPQSIAASHPGLTYRAFDLSEAGSDRIAEMLDTIVGAIHAGELRPVPTTSFELTEAEAAFRYMGQARHIGKLVLRAPMAMPGSQGDGTVLITGGLGALGLHTARWLVERGVRNLLLLGRSGASTAAAVAAIAELEARGATVKVASVDVADLRALSAVLEQIPASAPLRGVVHAAGVLDDGVLAEQTPARFARVLSAKAIGARNLDALTRSADLDYFVLFSSIAGTLGAAGQGAYAAANAFLDGLAWRRRAEGFPAHSLAWGPWMDGGMASELGASQQTRLSRRGAIALRPNDALALLAEALTRSDPTLTLIPLDLSSARTSFGAAVPAMWRTLIRAPAGEAKQQPPVHHQLRALPQNQRLSAILDTVRTALAHVLSLEGPQAVPDERPLGDLGLDSLMAVELRNTLATQLGVTLHATIAFDHPTPRALAKHLLESIFGEATEASAPPQVDHTAKSDRVARILTEIAGLSEAEQNALAATLLGGEN